jgi:16S rRNA (cytosine967-C5)-methyltransferase
MTSDKARRAAFDLLLAVERDGAYANLLMPRLLEQRRLDSRDAAFATEIGYGALRWQGVLDEVITSAARRPAADLDAEVRAVLRMGCYQLQHMRTPAHAAVHANVELARDVCGPKPVGFVNAVLRRCSERDWQTWVQRLSPPDEIGRVAFRHGYPRWIADAFLAALGGDLGQLEQALSEDRPSTHLVARPGRISRDELLAQAGPDATPGPWSPYAVRMSGGAPARLPAVRDGRAAVQDEGSQLAALSLASTGRIDGAVETAWLDLCAGPGGKAALLDALVPKGTRLLAVDLHHHRAQLVRRALDDHATVVVADGTAPAWPSACFDRVLVDAPCSGLGALRRRPEVRWRRTEDDVKRLQPLQVALLETAVTSAKPGGVVAYVTCSPHLAETRAVVDRVIAAHPHLRPLDAAAAFAQLPRAQSPGTPIPGVAAGQDVQLWPHRHGTDAMYVALLRVPDPSGGAST